MCESVCKADLLLDHFDCQQSREAVDSPLTCHPSPRLTTFAFRSNEVSRFLLDLEPYGSTDPMGMFPHFLMRTSDVLAPRLSVEFRQLIRLGHFPACWRQANVTPIPKGPPLLPITNRFPKHLYCLRCVSVWCRFVSYDLWICGVLPTTQFAYRVGLGTCHTLSSMSHILQCAL